MSMSRMLLSRRFVLGCGCAFLVGCSADAGPVGPQGPAGPEGPIGQVGPGQEPSISAVWPLNLYWEDEDTVTISGSSTQWDASTVIDFGPGVNVNQLTVASPTALVALVEADSTAPLGPTAVTVRSDADTTTFENAFRIDSPLTIAGGASTSPGGRLQVTAVLNNAESPFPDGPGPGAETYLAETGWSGSARPVEDDEFELTYFLPLTTPPGPKHLVLYHAASDTRWRSAPVDVAPLAVQPGPYGGSVIAQIPEAGGSTVYSVDAQAGQLVVVQTSFTSGAFGASLIRPDSIHDSVGQTFYAFQDETWFNTVYDILGATSPSPDYTLTIDTMTITPPVLTPTPTTGTLSGLSQTDVYQIDVAAGEELTVTLSDGVIDSCATIDAAVLVRDGSGQAVGVDIGGCASVTTSPAHTSSTYSVFVLPNPDCFCSFDYAMAATKN